MDCSRHAHALSPMRLASSSRPRPQRVGRQAGACVWRGFFRSWPVQIGPDPRQMLLPAPVAGRFSECQRVNPRVVRPLPRLKALSGKAFRRSMRHCRVRSPAWPTRVAAERRHPRHRGLSVQPAVIADRQENSISAPPIAGQTLERYALWLVRWIQEPEDEFAAICGHSRLPRPQIQRWPWARWPDADRPSRREPALPAGY